MELVVSLALLLIAVATGVAIRLSQRHEDPVIPSRQHQTMTGFGGHTGDGGGSQG